MLGHGSSCRTTRRRCAAARNRRGTVAVQLARVDELALITLHRPEVLNALDTALLRDLCVAVDQVASSDARALLVTGAGNRAFCAGADVKELVGRSLAARREGAALGQSVFAKLETLPIPSIALINGYAFGGGLELALACTFRIAAPTARLGLPEIKLGLIPGYGGTQRLPRLIGEARALEMILTGRAVMADEAERLGLVNRVVDGDLLEAGKRFAREMTGYSLPALRFARDAVRRGLATSLREGLEIEADLNTLASQTADATEGMTAFLEKRKPVFRDK
ncbi:MAG: enoyl-CoA hydratase/isomerase family protein [Alphaproteobacteria bacterium]|nr:enoyl-CoA hydratase/isomerase family protein [Alphaproteobacteria bacterium]